MSPTKKKLLAAAQASEAAAAAASSSSSTTTTTSTSSMKEPSNNNNDNATTTLPPVMVDEATIQARAAAARAYAFSGTTKKSSGKHKPPMLFTTPLVRPQQPSLSTKKTLSVKRKKSSPTVRRKIPPPSTSNATVIHKPVVVFDPDDDDYTRFVKSLDVDLMSLPPLPEDEEEDEYRIDDDDDLEEEDDDEQVLQELLECSSSNSLQEQPQLASLSPLHPLPADSHQNDGMNGLDSFSSELEAELGGLLEEDLEAALHVLGNGNNATTSSPTKTTSTKSKSPPCTPLKESTTITVSTWQRNRLEKLMQHHYQLLVQQSLLAIQAAQQNKLKKSSSSELGGESAEDLAEILDGAVGMLQDLNQNRKDAIRNSIQMMQQEPSHNNRNNSKRSLLPMLENCDKRLTRLAFNKTLLVDTSSVKTAFDVKGLHLLQQTFEYMDKTKQHGDCELLLRQAGAVVEEAMLPGARDLSLHLSRPKEAFGPEFLPPLTKEQESMLKRNRNQFTAAEDNLVLRGVNLYGEKQWLLIADRYLPDRSVNIISQRYSKLCLLLYQAHGVHIDAEGNLDPPPKNKNMDNLDEDALSKLKRVEPPAILNVHRWSLEEDLTLLKAVPLLGNMWAELSSRFMPHRDRGHLRKRYQVLERRVKATLQRSKKGGDASTPSAPKRSQSRSSRKKPKLATNEALHPMPPGAPPYHSNHLAAPGVKRMPNGFLHPGRKPGFQLAARGRPQMLPTAKSHFAAIAANGNEERNNKSNENVGMNHSKSRFDSLPAASSPELDATAGTESSSKQESTRTGFEKLLEEGTNDWSQMPRIKKMMENDTESMVASAIVSNLAQGGKDMATIDRGGSVERLPQIEVDSTTSSGFSVLNTATRDGNASADVSPTKAPLNHPGAPGNSRIWESVFEKTKKARPRPDETTGDQEEKLEPDDRSPLPVPSTPSRSSVFAVPTTPIGLSPGLKSTGFLSPAGFRSGFTPTGKMGFTPTGNSMMWNASGAASQDGYEICNFEISDRSRQAIESNGASGPKFGHPLTPSAAGLFAEGPHSLMANDFEAISALNSLSNSPARCLLKRPNSSTENGSSFPSSNAEKKGGEKMSFFAKAIGGVHDKESKKRRVS